MLERSWTQDRYTKCTWWRNRLRMHKPRSGSTRGMAGFSVRDRVTQPPEYRDKSHSEQQTASIEVRLCEKICAKCGQHLGEHKRNLSETPQSHWMYSPNGPVQKSRCERCYSGSTSAQHIFRTSGCTPSNILSARGKGQRGAF